MRRRRCYVRPCGVALVVAGVVTFHGVSRDIQLSLLCRILRRLHHVQPRRVETIRLIHRRRYWAGMANAVGTVLVTIAAAAAGLAVAGL
jgi:fluoride exporter